MPLFAVIFSHFILHERQSVRVYVALLPIVAGVIIASATELTFSSTAFGTALFSTGMYSFLNILVKKVFHLYLLYFTHLAVKRLRYSPCSSSGDEFSTRSCDFLPLLVV